MITVNILQNGKIKEGAIEDLHKPNTAWVDITGGTESELQEISKLTSMTEEELQNFFNRKTRIPTYDIGKHALLSIQIPQENGKVSSEPCLILVSKEKNNFITIHQKSCGTFDEMRSYSERHKQKIFEQGVGSLLIALFAEINDNFMKMINQLVEGINEVEQNIFNPKKSAQVMRTALQLKQKFIHIYRSLSVNRDVLFYMEKEDLNFMEKKELPLLRIVHVETTNIMELTGTYREILNSTTEIYLTTISNNLSITMKKVTSWGALILIPSLIASIFGMNFKHIPGLEHPMGFIASLGIMAGTVFMIYLLFKRSDWL